MTSVDGSVAHRIASIAWTIGTIVGLTAALVAGVAVAPPSRRNHWLAPDVAWAMGVPGWVVAVVVLAVLVVVRVPIRHRARGAEVGAVSALLVGILLACFLAWRLVVGADDDRGFAPAQARDAAVGLGVLLALVAGFAARCHVAFAPERARRAADRTARRGRAEARRRRARHLRGR